MRTFSLVAMKAKRLGGGGFAFEDQIRAVFDARGPFGGAAGSGAQDEDVGGSGGLRQESDGLQQEGPAALIFGEDAESGKGSGLGERHQERASSSRAGEFGYLFLVGQDSSPAAGVHAGLFGSGGSGDPLQAWTPAPRGSLSTVNK